MVDKHDEMHEMQHESAALPERSASVTIEETPREFRERLIAMLREAGVTDLRGAFEAATGHANLDAAIGAGLAREGIELLIAAFARGYATGKQSAPVPASQAPILPEAARFELQMRQARTFLSSGLLPPSIKTEEQIVTIAAMGEQLGVSPIAAINGIDVIQGRPALKPQFMLALAYRSGQLEDLQIEGDETACSVTIKRRGMTPVTSAFTLQDADRLGLLAKDNWRKQPATMLKWRAIAAALRVAFPDIIWGFYTPEEVESFR